MDFKLTKMNKEEKQILDMFQKSDLNARERNGLFDQLMTMDKRLTGDQPSTVTFDTDIAVARMNKTKQKTLSMTTMPRTPPPSRKSDDGGRMLFKKTSIFNLPPMQNNNKMIRSSSSDILKFEDIPQQKIFNEVNLAHCYR